MKNSILIILIAGILGIASCKKGDATGRGPYTLQSVFTNMALSPISVTLNANAGGTFYGSSGTRYYFPPYSFERDSVAIIGDVQLQAVEYLKKSDMIFSSILPFTNDTPLVSGGAFYVSATQNGKQLVIARPAKYQVIIPQSSTPAFGMQLFFGRSDDTVASNSVNWQPNTDTSHGSIVYSTDSLTINTDSMHFCAASQYLIGAGYQPGVSITITAPITPFSDSIMAYSLVDNMNSVWQMIHISNHVITENMLTNLPVHIVVFTIINGDFYSGIMGLSPLSGHSYSLNLTKSSPALLRSKIDAL